MYSVFLSVLIVWLFCIVIIQSARIREIKRFLDRHEKEIKILRELKQFLGRLEKEINILKEKLSELVITPPGSQTVQVPEPQPEPQLQPQAIPTPEAESVTGRVAAEESKERLESHAGARVSIESEKPHEMPAPGPETTEKKATDGSEKPDEIPPVTREPIGKRPAAAGAEPIHSFNWEDFLGAKLFAWIGGLSLFIAFAFLLKYSFDRNLISPAVRVVLGFLFGAGLVGGGLHLKRKTYEVTAQTLCATGIVILYASSFAANSIYHFIGPVVTFVLMILITAGAFILAASANARVIAILGMVGGFLTPPLLSTVQDYPFALFSYIAFLNVGLFCVAFYRKWNFLFALGALGTVLTQLGWTAEYFKPEKVFVAMAIYLWFCALYCAAFWYGKKIKRSDVWLAFSAAALPFVTLLFTLFLLSYRSIGIRPGVIFSFLLGADLCLLGMTFMEEKLQKVQLAAGGCVFLILSIWIGARMTPDLLIWALGGSFFFAILHSAIPMIAARAGRTTGTSWQSHIFPLVALFIILIPVIKGHGNKWLVWHFVFLFNAGILVLALFTKSVRAILGGLAVTGFLLLIWLVGGPSGAVDFAAMAILIGAFGIFFSIVATFALTRLRRTIPAKENEKPKGFSDLFEITNSDNLFFQIPIFSSVLPFLLLIIASSRVEITNPASIFGLGLLLTAIAIWLVRFLKAPFLLPVAMGGYFLLEFVVHLGHFNAGNASVFLGFYGLTTAVFFIFPFVYRQDYQATVVPWATAALSGPLHFFLIYNAVKEAYPNDIMGLLPAVMAVPFFFGLANLVGWVPKDAEKRDAILAWFGGSTLFFITLIFPIQFDHQWLTIGWALEGIALIWFFHKVPHPGLRGLGVALLLGTFLRLGMNPAILLDYPMSSYPIFNWYLYTYGIAICCMMLAGRLLAPPRNRVMKLKVPPVLYTLGTILAFILMNIEIADFFSTGVSLRFQFSGDLARGMTYSIAWALFALGLIIAGIQRHLRPVRFAAIGLIGVTLVKLFFFDLSRLDQLYRIGAFVGVAVVLIAASALYQKWVVRKI